MKKRGFVDGIVLMACDTAWFSEAIFKRTQGGTTPRVAPALADEARVSAPILTP